MSANAIAVLDLSERNTQDREDSGDYSRGLYSSEYMAEIAGYPYFTTRNLQEAMSDGKMILLSSCIRPNTFTSDEYATLTRWVRDGGIIVSPFMREMHGDAERIQAIESLFGLDASQHESTSHDRKLINWESSRFDDKELEYFDTPEEQVTSIGGIKTIGLTPASAETLAKFDDGRVAVTRYRNGKGAAYMVGIVWRDAVQRNQLNKDMNASRVNNNDFEPSADIWSLFLRSVYAANSDVSAWKFTVPAGYTQVLVPTHDCDSRTAYDAMHYMADYEKSVGLQGHYFLTTHYYSDKENFGHSYFSAFYNPETIPEAEKLIAGGHTVGSHSIGHFPDFDKCDNMDIVTRDEYAHRATCENGVSRGVSTWAEIVLSKQILEEDLGNNVRSFRSGHLCVNKDINTAMETGGYRFASVYTGADLLSEFPFFGRINNEWVGSQSTILHMPLHISDVYRNPALNDDNWDGHGCVDDWTNVMNNLRGNYASGILLVHPNREWKVTLQKRLVGRLDPEECGLYNFERYGDFWLNRFDTTFDYSSDPGDGTIMITTDIAKAVAHRQPFAIESTQPVTKVILIDPATDGTASCTLRQIAPARYLALPSDMSAIDKIPVNKPFNYADGLLTAGNAGSYRVYDVSGRLVKSAEMTAGESIRIDTLPGIYIVSTPSGTGKILIRP